MKKNVLTKDDLKECISEMVRGVMIMKAVIEAEYPNTGDQLIDVLVEELDKLRKSKTYATAGEDKDHYSENVPEKTVQYFDFGAAIHALKRGERVARKGWNGKNMSVAYQKGYPDGIPCNKNTAQAWGMEEGELFKCRPYLQMRCADGTFQMWLASQSDILADDWYIVE